MARVRIGCSGWSYDDWRGPFYPPELKAKDRLAFYASRFDTAELNASFYRLPSPAAVAGWAAAVAPGFVFAWKVSRYITHNKKLADCQDSIALVFGRMAGLGAALGPALIQLPPMLHRDDERLKRFLSWLPTGTRAVVEFRHASWYDETVLAILRDHGAALCISDHHDAPSPWTVTADWVYVRGHGPGGRYVGRYDERALGDWAAFINAQTQASREVFSYFDNDIKSAAPQDAAALKSLVGA